METVDKKFVKFGIARNQKYRYLVEKIDKLKSLEKQRPAEFHLEHLNDGEMKLKS